MIAPTQRNSGWRDILSRHPKTVVLFLYIIVSICMTWPLALNLRSTLFGDFGDTRGGIWLLWAGIHGLRNAPVCDLVSAPFGFNIGSIPSHPVFEALLFLPARLFGEVAAYNSLILLAFPATAFATFFMLSSITGDKLESFVGGLIFGFNPAAVMHVVGGHTNFAFNMFIPLLLLALFYNRSKRTLLSAFFVGLCFSLVTLNALYFGYFSIFIILFFIVFDLLTFEDRKAKIIANYFTAACFAVVFILPFQYKMILRQFAPAVGNGSHGGLMRDFTDLLAFSARPLEYLLPSIDHPVLGRFIINFSRDNLHGSNLFEQTLYLGVVPLLLCLAGFFLWTNTRDNSMQRRYFLFFMAGALWMFFLSMPPYISVWNMKLPTVSYFMYKIAPMFRAYARFGILVNFFVACAAAVVLSVLSDRMQKGRYYLLVALLLPLLVFEYWSIPPNHAREIVTPPAVYQWLAKEAADVIIAEYPMMKSDEASFYTYLFWQRIHKKRIVNGATPDNTQAWDFFQKVKDLGNSETPKLLQETGVKYIIVHKQMYQEGEIPGPIKRYYPPDAATRQYDSGKVPVNPSLPQPFKVFGDDVVYALEPPLSGTTLKKGYEVL